MNSERRNEIRLEKRLLVNISNDNGYDSMGLTTNISKEGMFIAIPEHIPLNTEVSILIGIADDTFTVKGKVIWSQEWKDDSSTDIQAAVGIKISDAPAQYLKYVEKVDAQSN